MQVIISMRPLRTAALIPVYCTSFNLGATLVEGSVNHPLLRLLPEKGRRVALNCANQGQGAVGLNLFFDLTQLFVLHFRRNTCLGLFGKFIGLHWVVKNGT
jgi:hypothetical protein